jgi:hypothetical protein
VNRNSEYLVTRARELFDESVENIDAAARSRLTQARCAALAESGRHRFRAGSWLPAGALAAAAVLAVVFWSGPEASFRPLPVFAAAPAEDLDLLAVGDDLDMLGEDAEFYAWVAGNPSG